MKKKIFLSAILSVELLYGVDVRFGKGKLDMDMNMLGIFNINESIDINTLTIANPHDNIGESNFYFFYDADVYQSDYIDTMVDMMKIPLNNIPGLSDVPNISGIPNAPSVPGFSDSQDILPIQNRNLVSDTIDGLENISGIVKNTGKKTLNKVSDTLDSAGDSIKNTAKKIGNTANNIADTGKKIASKNPADIIDDAKKIIPTPFDIKVKGFDMNIGAGYDVYKDSRGYIGVGAATGLSMPYFYMKNKPSATAAILTGLMKSTNTSMTTYKASLSLQGSYMILDGLNVDTTMLYGYQFGKVDNDWFASEVDIDGITSMIGFSVSYNMGYILNWADGLTVSAGYTRKNWDVDHTDVKLMGGLLGGDLSQNIDAKFDTENYYLGIGYRF